MEKLMKNNSKAMEAKEGSAAMHSRSSCFYNGRTKIFKQRQLASHAGDPWARQTANGNGDLALTDASPLLHCHGRTSPAPSAIGTRQFDWRFPMRSAYRQF